MKIFKNHGQKGFTLVEMLVVAPIVILTIGAFLTVIISMTGEVLASRASNSLSYNVQDGLNRIEQDVKMSNGFLATNNIPLAADTTYTNTGINTNEKEGYNDDTTAFTNVNGAAGVSGTSLILNMVATTTNPISTSSSYVYLKNKPNACANAAGFNAPFSYNVVYFTKTVSGITTLYRRTIMPNSYSDTTNTVCNTPWQQPSCSPTYMDGQSGSVFCKTKDVVLVSGTSVTLALQYFNGESTTAVNSPASTSSLPADRNVALQSATTVGVSISAQQTAAGRPIERAAILRVSRLDSNASGVATITTDSIPTAPKVSSSTSEPTNVTFSWPKVTAATGYTFEYTINGGAVNTGFTNQATQTFTVTSATHKDVVVGQVKAINAAGSSGYGSSTVTIPLWTSFTLQNSWVDYSPPYSSAAYTKTSAGVIVLKGMVRAGSGNIATLPAGYRPALNVMFENSSNQTAGRVDVRTDGTVGVSIGSTVWFSLDGIAFMPASTTFTTPALLNGWVNYSPSSGDPNWLGAGYITDSLGRVQIGGLVRAGTATSGTPIFTPPSPSTPAEYMHLLDNNSGGASIFSIAPTTGVVTKGGSNTYLSLQAMYYPTGRTTGTTCTTQWCTMALQNSWAYYGAPFTLPQYTKSADGMVLLKGLLNAGSSASAQMTTLPVGYCPAETLLFATASNATWSRLDVIRNGDGTCSVVPAAGSTVWVSLDNIHYIAEP